MNQLEKLLKRGSIITGGVVLGFFIFDFIFFENLRPRMVLFEAITQSEENLFILTGVGLLFFMVFCLVSFFRMMNFIRRAQKISLIYIVAMVCCVISLQFIFGDLALISDIGKQYHYGLGQPEWLVLYFVMGFQIISTLVLLYFHLFQFKQEDLVERIGIDNNIFLIVQFIGLLCGSMGLVSISFGYLFPKAWTLETHTTMSMIILLFPYGIAVGYWLFSKWHGKERRLYDEKQKHDIGRSAFLTLIFSVICLTAFFILNYNNLGGVTSILWLPFFLFVVLFLFSLGNIYFCWKE